MATVRLINSIRPGTRGSVWRAGVLVDFDGLSELIRNFSENKLVKILTEAMQPMADMAKTLCPVSKPPYKPTVYHGALRDSIRIGRVYGEGRGVYVALMAGSVKVYYGAFVEFGFGNVAAQPFLRPAWDSLKDSTRDIIKLKLWELVPKRKRFKEGSKLLP